MTPDIHLGVALGIVTRDERVVLARRTHGEAGRRKDGLYHLVNEEQFHRPGHPDFRGEARLKAWCGATFGLGPSEVLGRRSGNGSPLVADLCRRCFLPRRAR